MVYDRNATFLVFLRCHVDVVDKSVNRVQLGSFFLDFENERVTKQVALLALHRVVRALELVDHNVLRPYSCLDQIIDQLRAENLLAVLSGGQWPVCHLSEEHWVLVCCVNFNFRIF